MASKLQSKSSAAPAAPRPYSPSVPISVYRELAAEVHTLRAQLDAASFQNKGLVEQNQKLRLEIERIVQSALHLRQISDGNLTAPAPALAAQAQSHAPSPDLMIPDVVPADLAALTPADRETAGSEAALVHQPELEEEFDEDEQLQSPALLFTTAPAANLRRIDPSSRPGEIRGWQLAAIITFIVITAFGAGFLLVRPMLPSQR
jgi:hypothetical protein